MTRIKLLKHNQEMVEQIEAAMVNGSHKIFYTEATGLGKSFIFMYLVNKYFKNKRVLYICPKNHIWYNLNSYKEFNLIKDCVDMLCYADFNKIKDRHLGYDVIIIDEVHHLTTQIQGDNILKVVDMTLDNNPNAYIFGLTATPYVNGEMIGNKYFDTSVVGMDLLSAIDAGILQKINYAVAIQEDIILTEEEQMMTKKYNIDTTKNTVLDIVHNNDNVNHWLVYFSRINELNENIQYFEKHFTEFKLFIIHSEIENCDTIIKQFEEYDGKAMLVSVSMVLEGIHPKTIEGILLYRNVYSNNTLLQIIGRLGIINPNSNPIFVDIYGSYDNFITSKNVKNISCNEYMDDENETEKRIRNYIYMNSNTYKFIDLSSLIYRFRYNKMIHEYRGITWTTDTELSRKLGKGESYVSGWINNGKTHKEIIDYVLDMKKSNEYRGITWTTDTELSRKLGKGESYVCNSRHKGKTYEEIIDYVLDRKKSNEYRGITWKNMTDLSRKLGKNDLYVAQLLRRKGKTYEEIIDEFLDFQPNEYRGITWTSNTELSKKLGKSRGYVTLLYHEGKSYTQIIDHVLDMKKTNEYRGITWITDIDLSIKMGKSIGYVARLRRKGKTYEEIIDEFLDFQPNEYRGITWTSNTELSKKLGKSSGYIYQALKQGKTYEEIIDEFLDFQPNEYRGITWVSNAELSKKLGKSRGYVTRLYHEGKSYTQIIDHVLDKKG